MPPPPPPGVAALAARLAAHRPRLGRTRLVCVDGPAGSGKTTLAAALCARLDDAVVMHMDDVYRGWDTDFDEVMARLRTQVVRPLLDQQAGRYQVYDWHRERFDRWVDVPPPGVLLLEGVGSGSGLLDDVRSALLWIEAEREERIRRGVERDGPQVLPQWLAWMRHEEAEHARQRTRDRADVVLRGDATDTPG